MTSNRKKIAIVVGEDSGDYLGAELIEQLRQRYPDAEFIGLAGPKMQALGMRSFFPFEKLSLMGLVIKQLPELFYLRFTLKNFLLREKPDIFIGIDAPDFNLGLEKQLRNKGIKTIHYPSPSVWAWRSWRWRKIKKAVDLMLCLFPFEVDFYRQYDIPAKYVGHPLARKIPFENDQAMARQQLNLPQDKKLLAILPGSRRSEIECLTPIFFEVARQCLVEEPGLSFIVPAANPRCRELLMHLQPPDLPLTIIDGQARLAMIAADTVLLSSGTATLECALVKRPMVVAYRLPALTYHLVILMINSKFFALPNVLAGKEIAPEFIQDNATSEKITPAVLRFLAGDKQQALAEMYQKIHQDLNVESPHLAAEAIVNVMEIE